MTDWSQGYVTDSAYRAEYFVEQSPLHLALSCWLRGVACDLPTPDAPVHFLELGCGNGFTALVLAASNPGWRVTAIDFNPAAIGEARALAREAGLLNIAFLEADLATLAEQPLAETIPPADFVSLHGVWTWVGPAVRAGIVRLLRERVKAGGVVHVGYNALPGWQGSIGLQRLLRVVARNTPGPVERRVQAGVARLKEMLGAAAVHLAAQPAVRHTIEEADHESVAYLAHEYLNEDWNPCFHADLARDLAEAKLDWVGSADLPENFLELRLTPAQRRIVEQIADPLERELVQDMCTNRRFRRDVFVRGARRMHAEDQQAALGGLVLALAVPPAEFDYTVQLPVGPATLSEGLYRPVVAALAERPRPVAELLSLPGQTGPGASAAELISLLVGRARALPVMRPGAGEGEAAARFNRAAARRLLRPETMDDLLALASETIGAGFPAKGFDLFVLDQERDHKDPGLARWLAAATAKLPNEESEVVHRMVASSLHHRVPLFRTGALNAAADPPPMRGFLFPGRRSAA